METIVCLNGDFIPAKDARVSPLQAGLLYGYGLFETIRIYKGAPLFLDRHLTRLASSAVELNINMPAGKHEIILNVGEMLKRNNLKESALRLTIASEDVDGSTSFLLIHPRPLSYKPDDYFRGFRAGYTSMRRNQSAPLVKHKSLNYMENILARREARLLGLDEALFINTDGNLAEGSISNVFIIRNEIIITPSLDQGLLPGITRGIVLEICLKMGLRIEERAVAPGELHNADECFLTNSLMGVMPLVAIDGKTVGSGVPGWLTGQISRVYRNAIENELLTG